MKKVSLLISLILALLIITPALANPNQPTGDRISIFESGAQEYPAGTEFYIQHGWANNTNYPPGKFSFSLEVDGVFLEEAYIERSVIKVEDGKLLNWGWVFNFPEGMTGTHTFRGHWFEPCQVALDGGLVDECTKKNVSVEVKTTEVVVTFVP